SGLDGGSELVPLAAVAAFMSALALLMVLPAGVKVIVAVATSVSGGLGATLLAAGSRYSWRHHITTLRTDRLVHSHG
ncbi:hypothetical protein KKJ05_21225, partial [Xenorhabdus bovienii]|nr:hypothetical protein [Xenorhabdus bovienii]